MTKLRGAKEGLAALKAIAVFTKLPADRFASWGFTKQDYCRAPDGIVGTAILRKKLDLQHDLGLIKDRIDAKRYVDMSYIEAAARRLN